MSDLFGSDNKEYMNTLPKSPYPPPNMKYIKKYTKRRIR